MFQVDFGHEGIIFGHHTKNGNENHPETNAQKDDDRGHANEDEGKGKEAGHEYEFPFSAQNEGGAVQRLSNGYGSEFEQLLLFPFILMLPQNQHLLTVVT